jgi:tetratricopeptide (TPR) repeat protein
MDLDVLVERYEALGEEGDFVAAKVLFEQAAADREDPVALNAYGCLLESHGRSELRQAAALYERAIELDPGFDKPHYQLISVRAGLREPERVVSVYEQRLRANPRSVREHRFLVQAYLVAFDYAKALAIADAGLALAPADACRGPKLRSTSDSTLSSGNVWTILKRSYCGRNHERASPRSSRTFLLE